MRIDSYTKEMMDESSFIDMSYIFLQDVGKDTDLYDIIDKFKAVGGYSDDEIEKRVSQFYTDLNTDGRFLSTGDGIWGLRDWYSVSDISEKISPTIHKFELAADDEEEIEPDEDDDDFFKESDDDETVDEDTDLDDTVEEDATEIEYDDTDDLEDNYDDDDDEAI